MSTALVTGHRGFIGRHAAAALEDAGYEVDGVDLPAWDARDIFRRETDHYDVVIHAAAAGADRASIDRTPLALAVNLELDAALFAWAARTRPGRVIYLSSSAAYPVLLQNDIAVRLHESFISLAAPGEPDGIYGWAKLTGERLAGLTTAAGVPVSVVRPFSGYGEDQGERFPFGAIAARAARREDPLTVWGPGTQVRDFIHVDDITTAILTMIREGIDGPVNLGTGLGTSMTSLARLMAAQAGYDPVIDADLSKPCGVRYRVADPSAMHEFHEPAVSLADGIERTMTRAMCA